MRSAAVRNVVVNVPSVTTTQKGRHIQQTVICGVSVQKQDFKMFITFILYLKWNVTRIKIFNATISGIEKVFLNIA